MGQVVLSEFKNPYKEDRKKSPGQVEVETGSRLVQVFRLLGIRMVYQSDVKAVERVGVLVQRWWRNTISLSGGSRIGVLVTLALAVLVYWFVT